MSSTKLSDNQIIREIQKHQSAIKISRAITIISFFCIIALPLGFIFNVAFSGSGMWGKIMIAGLLAIPIGIISAKINTSHKKKLKAFVGEHLIKDIIAEKIDVIEYLPNPEISTNTIKKCTLLPSYDRLTASDYIRGTYKGVDLTYYDLLLEQEQSDTDDEGHTTTTFVTVFKGPLIQLSLKQAIDGFVKIKERKTSRKAKGFFSNVLSGASDILGIKTKDESIEVENAAFNNQFEIKTSNPEMSFYILTPQFMENIMRADELANGYTNIEFRGKNAFIAIHNGYDSFEITKTVLNKKSLDNNRQQLRNDLRRILAIIDEIIAKDNLF